MEAAPLRLQKKPWRKKINHDDDFRCNAMPAAGGGGVPIGTLLEKRSAGEGK